MHHQKNSKKKKKKHTCMMRLTKFSVVLDIFQIVLTATCVCRRTCASISFSISHIHLSDTMPILISALNSNFFFTQFRKKKINPSFLYLQFTDRINSGHHRRTSFKKRQATTTKKKKIKIILHEFDFTLKEKLENSVHRTAISAIPYQL